jgi:hypothetical protein
MASRKKGLLRSLPKKRVRLRDPDPDEMSLHVGTVEDLPGDDFDVSSVANASAAVTNFSDGSVSSPRTSSGCRQTQARISEGRSFRMLSDDEPGSLFDVPRYR